MAIGIDVQPAEINNLIGNAGRDFFGMYQRTKALCERLTLYQDSDLTAIGFSPTDITAIRNFVTLAMQLAGVFDGTTALPTPVNFLQAVSPVIGAGL